MLGGTNGAGQPTGSRTPVRETPAAPPSPSPTETPSLRHSVRDGCAHSVMLGAGEAYLSPFAIFLGAGSLLVGLLASLPLLVGALAQMGSVYLLDRIPRRRALVTIPALLQAMSWVPLFLLPLAVRDYGLGPDALLACALAYFAFGSFSGGEVHPLGRHRPGRGPLAHPRIPLLDPERRPSPRAGEGEEAGPGTTVISGSPLLSEIHAPKARG